jgi:hypothetical protein
MAHRKSSNIGIQPVTPQMTNDKWTRGEVLPFVIRHSNSRTHAWLHRTAGISPVTNYYWCFLRVLTDLPS